MYHQFKSWSRVFWRMWGMLNYLFCKSCSSYFSLDELEMCPKHTKQPTYAANARGTYDCCGKEVFRFNPFDTPTGCTFVKHSPDVSEQPRAPELMEFVDEHGLIELMGERESEESETEESRMKVGSSCQSKIFGRWCNTLGIDAPGTPRESVRRLKVVPNKTTSNCRSEDNIRMQSILKQLSGSPR
ncbi:hypothetical protein BJ742DRAFT_733886 [Cladochytrium replicatum]|nr:hypothetical protein BJ742DRAFT_733886 [Cladochytrium replicatum]